MFATTVLPPVVSLFSSTGNKPLQLFSEHTDSNHPNDSFFCLLVDESSEPAPPPPRSLVTSPSTLSPQTRAGVDSEGRDAREGKLLCQTVLHIQSPSPRSTFIRCPPLQDARKGPQLDLGLSLPRMHVQVRTLGRDWSFECGIVDKAGRSGVVRFSTFQKEARLVRTHQPPLLHVPLRLPQFDPSAYALTPWSTIDVDFRTFVPQFQIIGARDRPASDDLGRSEGEQTSRKRPRDPIPLSRSSLAAIPTGAFDHVSYVKIYATCRIRRIWFDDGRTEQKVPWEFELYGT